MRAAFAMTVTLTVAMTMIVSCGESVPERSRVIALAAGDGHTCALIAGGDVRCFGRNEFGQLGIGSTEPIGDDEYPIEGGVVELPEPARSVHAGGNHSCAIGVSGALFCWGQNTYGQLGMGHTDHIGDDEPPGASARVPVGQAMVGVAVGGLHTCALDAQGQVRCFGNATNGQLGYGDVVDLGDDEPASVAQVVAVGATVSMITAGTLHTCAMSVAGEVVCWGRGEPPLASAPGGWGQLGYGHRENIGDDETPASAGPVDVGGVSIAIDGGAFHQCAVLEGGALRCWGRGEGRDNFGQLGIGIEENIGDDEPASAAGDIAIGRPAIAASAGDVHTCVLTDQQTIRCFGFAGFGQLGYGNQEDIGDDELPEVAGDVPVGGAVSQIVSGKFHTCVLLENEGTVRCFGLAAGGEVGSATTDNIGDNERPDELDPIVL